MDTATDIKGAIKRIYGDKSKVRKCALCQQPIEACRSTGEEPDNVQDTNEEKRP